MGQTQFCNMCGAKQDEGARYCDRCGKATDDANYSQLKDGTPIEKRDLVNIGRYEDNDIVVNRPFISGKHATLKRAGDGYTVIDHKTLSGTYINGEPVWGKATAKAGDTVGIGSFDFKIKEDLSLRQRNMEGSLFLEGWNLTYRVRKPNREVVEILSDASLVVYPGELVGILGPSGHGKTTLLNALIRNLVVSKRFRQSGEKLPALEGETWVNTEPLGPNYHAYMRVMGFVPQDDLVHADLTVREALRYTHKLRLPADHSKKEIEQRIEQVLEALALDRKIWDQRIGSPEKRGISGGERKRVNIAIELLTDPDILVLDEPTSGLASTDALTVVRILEQIALRGKTVIFTVHQPSTRVLKLVTKLAIVAKSTVQDLRQERRDDTALHRPGRVVYYGPAYGERGEDGALPECAARFFHEDNFREEAIPDEDEAWEDILLDADSILEGLDTRPVSFWNQKYYYEYLSKEERESASEAGLEEGWGTSLYRRYLVDRSVHREDKAESAPMARLRRPPGVFHQWLTLTSRFALTKWKAVFSLFVLLAQAPVIGFTLVWVYHDTFNDAANNLVHIPLFLLVTVAIWFGCSNSAREIVCERVIFHRERMLGLSIPAYILSKATVLLLLSVFQSMILLGLVHHFIGLHGKMEYMLLIMVLSAMGGVGMGFLLSAVVPTPEAANAFVPLLLIPQLVFGGLMQPVSKMDPLPTVVANMMPTRWGYEALLFLEEDLRNHDRCPRQCCNGHYLPKEMEDAEDALEECRSSAGRLEQLKGLDPDSMFQEDDAGTEDEANEKESDKCLEGTSKPEGACMPTQFTLACQFVVNPSDDATYRASSTNWVYDNLTGGNDRCTTCNSTVLPEVPIAVLILYMLVFHVAMYFVLRVRDVGVDRGRTWLT